MKRDGAQISLWQNTVADFKPNNNWEKDTVYDVLIVGGGITGLTTAITLLQEGKKCIVAEANNIGFGTSGGTTAHLNTLLDTPYSVIEKKFNEETAKMVARGSREAIDLIEGLINKYNIDCGFSYQTAYLYAEKQEETSQLDQIYEATAKAGVVASQAMSIPVPIPFEKAYRFEFQAQMHATRYLHGLAKAIEQEGGVILQQCLVNDIDNKECIYANTSLGTIKARNVVYATHLPPGLTIFDVWCAPYRSYATAFTLKSGSYPDGLAYDMQEPYHYIRSQEVDGITYVIAGGFDHKTGHNNNTDHNFLELEAYIRKYFDVDTITHKWSSQYYDSTDGLPFIGYMPGHNNIFVATGFGGNGMTFGSLSAKVICSLITIGSSPFQDVFNPARIKPVASFQNFVRENADVISMFIGKRLSYEKITELVQLAPGEATVAKWESQHVALYKDENGRIHALDPVCPHAKCIVSWNSAEKSWDCPCHGGRYAANGAFLTGPARKGLTQIKWEDIEGD